MRSNKAKDTGPELRFRRALRDVGLSGYRLHLRNVPGRPDVSYSGKKVAIFINGCFWHRCPKCKMQLPESHSEFWQAKFERNIKRDREKIKALTSNGWQVLVIWECEVEKDLVYCIDRVRYALEGRKDE